MAVSIVSPEDFGTVGQGDDTAAVQAWIDDALACGLGLHMLDNHEYICPSGLTINGQGSDLWGKNNILLAGCGSASKLTVNGNIGIDVNNTDGTNFLKLTDMQISSEVSNTLLKTKCIYGLMVLDGVALHGGATQIHLASNGASGGSLSLQARDCEFDGAEQHSILNQAGATNLVENHHLDGCQFFDYARWAIYSTGADGMSLTKCRLERPSGPDVWPNAQTVIHFDNGFKLDVDKTYLEDGGNVSLIDIGASHSCSIRNNILNVNVSGGANFTNAHAFQTIGQPVDRIVFNHNRITTQGSINQVYTATVTSLERRYNRVDVLGTATKGFEDGNGTGMNSEGNVVNGNCTNKFSYTEPKRT